VTDIERKLEEYLNNQNIQYAKDTAVGRASVPDFVVGKLLIYADGERFHSSKKAQYRDNKINDKLTKLGYTILRFTGRQIHHEFETVASKIQEKLKCIQSGNHTISP